MLFTVTLLIACALIAAVSIPLVLRIIPPNRIYGVRTQRTLADSATWFEVNAFGGKALAIAAGVSALLLMVYSGTLLRPAWAQVAARATLYYERKVGSHISGRAG
jgi:uncharacterized membrane protein